MDLIHYIFVRKDLPLGVLAAMICHASGESGALYQDEYDGRFRGATAVILESSDEAHLNRIDGYLFSNGIMRVCVFESTGTFANQLMAIGVVPGKRSALGPIMAKFQTLKTCLDNTSTTSSQSSDTNEFIETAKETTTIPCEG